MEKILLCGNGINIQFNEKFQLNEFIEILKNEGKLMERIDIILSIPTYKEWHSFSLEFLRIVRKCKKQLNNLFDNSKKNGVEVAILIFFDSVDTFMRIKGIEITKDIYDRFKKFFKILFFSYIYQLEILQPQYIYKSKYFEGLKNKLANYFFIYTLNYDSILENLLLLEDVNKEEIVHLHGKMIFDDKKHILNYENCLLYDEQGSKHKYLPNIPLIRDENLKGKQKLELDILGLNPINDENILALFINSKVCKNINFYYHSENDLINLKNTLDKNQYLWLRTDKKGNIDLSDYRMPNFNDQIMPRFHYKYDKEKNKYIIYFYDHEDQYLWKKIYSNNSLEINLIHSSVFWNQCKNEDIKLIASATVENLKEE